MAEKKPARKAAATKAQPSREHAETRHKRVRPIGGYVLADGDLEINAGRPVTTIEVYNTGDRPIQVGSHFHFYEVNRLLEFDRDAAYGQRLDIPATTAVRFEPGDKKTVDLVPFGGKQRVFGFNALVQGWTGQGPRPGYNLDRAAAHARVALRGFKDRGAGQGDEPVSRISRPQYADLFGPTVGDKIRLANTDLYIEVERDLRVLGDEAVYGGGKTLRDGMGMDNQLTSSGGALDLVITNVVIVNAVQGVVKADVGIKDGTIVGIGKAGNPATMDGVTPALAVGPATDAISGEHMILTAGGFDAHVHYISPQQAYAALSNGVTTLWGGGVGPTDGTNGTTITSGVWNLERMLRSVEALPINMGFLGKGNCTGRAPLVEQIVAGASGLKVHEDWGTTPAAIRAALSVAEDFDIQVSIHTDTLNEAGFVEDTIAAFEGRTIHTFHTEGAGGGHAPDIMKVAGELNVLPSSTNPTLPFGVNSQAELFDMIMVCHNLNPKIPSDVAFAESRVRAETIAAESVLHDLGVISMISSDSQAMGRVGETWLRAVQTANAMKAARGALSDDAPGNDNFRVLRYVAKVTINPAITQGVSHVIGSVEVGKMADLVLWEPAFFGAKPKLVIKGGMISWSVMGDPNASLPTPQPVIYRPMFGAFGAALTDTCVTFVSRAGYDAGVAERLDLHRQVIPVAGTRTLTKRDMIRNGRTPRIDVDPETFAVTVDGEHATVPPTESVALGQMYFFS